MAAHAVNAANPNVSAEAQEEFDNLFAAGKSAKHHPDDKDSDDEDDKLFEELDDEAQHIQSRIADTMRMPVDNSMASIPYRLPDESFDRGRRTGVKGIVADARQELRRLDPEKYGGDGAGIEEERREVAHLREARIGEIKKRREMENDIRDRRLRKEYGTFDFVDAAGLDTVLRDAPKDTVVAIFIYDDASELSNWFLEALFPLTTEHPRVHFVKIHRERLDFEPAGVPAIVAYCKEKGEGPFANLTPLEEFMPDDVELDTDVLKGILRRYEVL